MWLEVNVSCPVADCFLYYLVDESDHCGVLILHLFGFGNIGNKVGLVEAACADTEVLRDCLGDLFWVSHEPLHFTSADGIDPAIHYLVGGPECGECNRGFLFLGIVAYCLDRNTLIFVNHPQRKRSGWIVNQLDVFDYGDFYEVGQFG